MHAVSLLSKAENARETLPLYRLSGCLVLRASAFVDLRPHYYADSDLLTLLGERMSENGLAETQDSMPPCAIQEEMVSPDG